MMAQYAEGECEELRYSPPPPYNTDFTRQRKHYTPDTEQDRIELRIRCPSVSSFRWCLKLYCLVFGGLGSILSFLWVIFHFYVLGETDSIDLQLQRYLDISLGLVMFCSTVSLIYGGYAESKTWLVIYITGSMSVLVLYWSWSAYTSYVQLEQPAYNEEVENLVMFLSFLYFVLLVPILIYYRALMRNSEASDRQPQHCCEESAGREDLAPKQEKV